MQADMKEWQASSSECSTMAPLKELNADFGLSNTDDLERLESEQERPSTGIPVHVDERNSMSSPDTSALGTTNRKRK